MRDYELEADQITQWAVDYADYEDLEKVAKAVYGVYVQQRKNNHPEDQKKNRTFRRKFTNTGEFAKPKKSKTEKRRARAQRQMAQHAERLL